MPVGARFSSPVLTGPVAHPASYTMGTGSFPEVKRPGRGFDHQPPSSAEVKERIELYLYFPSGCSWPILGRILLLPAVRRFPWSFQCMNFVCGHWVYLDGCSARCKASVYTG